MPETKNPQYYLVSADVLPDIFIKVIKAKEKLETGEAATVAEAVNALGISRSAFYKYKDSVTPFLDMKSERIVIFNLILKNKLGALSSVLSIFANWDANILTISQNVPVHGSANLSVTAEISGMKGRPEGLLQCINGLENIIKAEILAG
ncbi:MAG: ACT domain-containing protein [Clostridiales bacterium]|jgi:chorismate mutase|nr:ACT domain-containing protein [Clostridiales bacterium]